MRKIGIDRATIRKRFRNNEYTLVQNKYISINVNNTKANNNYNDIKDINISVEQFNNLDKRIVALEKQLKKLNNINTQQQYSNNNDIRFYKNESVVRAYRVDTEIQQKFKDYCSRNSQYKISDIISTALEDFLNKYDK